MKARGNDDKTNIRKGRSECNDLGQMTQQEAENHDGDSERHADPNPNASCGTRRDSIVSFGSR